MSHPAPTLANYKTVRLRPGRHPSPKDGVCVMELASMLAQEPFSDRPRSVCAVIGALLRAYNDAVDDRRRQRLFAFATLAVQTRSTPRVENLRIERCLAWATELRRRRRLAQRIVQRIVLGPVPHAPVEPERAAHLVVQSLDLHTDASHQQMATLVAELCAIGDEPGPAGSAATPGSEARRQPDAAAGRRAAPQPGGRSGAGSRRGG